MNTFQFQIRFLGYKGVVSIDDRLEGIMMCLRPSMEKFKVNEVEEADIEIAQAFVKPGQMQLNRCSTVLKTGCRKVEHLTGH